MVLRCSWQCFAISRQTQLAGSVQYGAVNSLSRVVHDLVRFSVNGL